MCLLFIATGCTLNTYRKHPEFNVRAGSLKEPVLISPDITMYELLPGGTAILRDDWSRIGSKNLQNAILRDFKDKRFSVKLVEMDMRIDNELTEIQSLYKLVHKTMDQHTFGRQRNVANSNDFNFSLGPLEPFLQKIGADSIIFVTGYDQVFFDGRKALIDLAIADASGTIVYYTVKGTTNGKDLRDPDSTKKFIHDLLSSFPRVEG
jgi:hypothetical protein